MISSSPALTVAPGAAPAMLHVLVVDDDEDIRSLICQYLHGYAMSCVGVGDGRAMREAMASRPFDVIVLDLMLPGESGLTLCKEIRSQSAV